MRATPSYPALSAIEASVQGTMTVGLVPNAIAALTNSAVTADTVPFPVSAIIMLSDIQFTSNYVCLITK